ncbi:MAG: type VI secretion system protein TssA [Planctomycetes bacterium]|jgi:type VI secretion system protein VasJ|nr:type VI secretion system protein TssA [Planctomycetota bacterium]
MDFTAIRALGTTPVPGANPAGESVRYDPDFEALSAEIEKLTSVEQTAVDWGRVVQLATNLLGKGKDLLVGSYLACGLLEKQGYAGLHAGCDVLRDLITNFWEGLFPEKRRLRARIAALDWLASRLEKTLGTKGEAGTRDREGVEGAIATLQAIVSDEGKQFEGEGPNLAPAIRALRAKQDTIPRPVEQKPEPKPETTAAAPEAAKPAAPPPPPPPAADPVDPEAVGKALLSQREKQCMFASVLRKADAADPRAYLLLRESLWNDFAAPAPDENGRVTSKIGDQTVLDELQKLLDDGEFGKALERAEELLQKHPLWLDLQLVVVSAVDGLGRRYARVRHAAVEALAFLLRRTPAFAEAADERGKPLASNATRIWLQNEVLATAAGPSANAASEVGTEARKLVARGKLGEAIRMLTSRIDATASRRGRFELRLEMTRVCIEAGRIDLSVPQLVQLEQEITHFSLEEWEPELAAEVVRLLWQCCSGPKPAPSLAARGQDIYARLCRLDPAAAVSATGPQGE